MSSKAGELQEKKRKPGTFVKGDPRINRKGAIKPRAQRELEALLDEIFDEELTATNNLGKPENMTELKALLKRMIRSKNIGGGIYALDRRFGKMPQVNELTGANGAGLFDDIVRVIEHKNEEQ